MKIGMPKEIKENEKTLLNIIMHQNHDFLLFFS